MNKYEIIGIVGEGAYGIVYKAKCKETGEFGKCPGQGHFCPPHRCLPSSRAYSRHRVSSL